VFRSTDGGLTWTADATQPTGGSILSLSADGTAPLAGTREAGVWRYTM